MKRRHRSPPRRQRSPSAAPALCADLPIAFDSEHRRYSSYFIPLSYDFGRAHTDFSISAARQAPRTAPDNVDRPILRKPLLPLAVKVISCSDLVLREVSDELVRWALEGASGDSRAWRPPQARLSCARLLAY